MHDLFTKVLSKRDLSRAGDLFSVADSEIVNDLTNVVSTGCVSLNNLIQISYKSERSSPKSTQSFRILTIRRTQTINRLWRSV